MLQLITHILLGRLGRVGISIPSTHTIGLSSRTFFVLKPTLTSSTKRKYKPEDFPEILLCPEPSIDIQALKSLGYTSKESYQAGFDDNEFSSQFLGWTGNNSESVEEVIQKISVLKAAEDCAIEGKSKIWYTTNEKEEGVSENIKFNLKHALYPHHLCCELITPKAASHHHIAAISLRFSLKILAFISQTGRPGAEGGKKLEKHE